MAQQTSRSSTATLAITVLALVAASAVAPTGSGDGVVFAVNRPSALHSARAPPQLAELEQMDHEDDDAELEDFVSFIGVPGASLGKAARAVGSGTAASTDKKAETAVARPSEPEESEDWQVQFAWGMYHSQATIDTKGEWPASGWVLDTCTFASTSASSDGSSGGGVPRRMLRAEELLGAAVAQLPDGKPKRDKDAERALRFYNHAKWLAEKGLSAASECRYHQASALAKASGRKVLAAHAMSRLGYYLMYWNRHDEARQVLIESERLSKKSNPLAPFLFGVLERRAASADGDEARLEAAEQRILDAGDQPSEELQAERTQLVKEIEFWRTSVASPKNCFAAFDVANVLVCLAGHLMMTGRLIPKMW